MQAQKISTYLWFDHQAEEAARFYVSVFKDRARITEVVRWPEGTAGPVGAVLNVTFELFGQQFIAINGGPQFKFNEAISLFVTCESQDEVDAYWSQLTAGGGAPSQRSGPVFATVSRGNLHLLLSGPGSSGSRPMPDGRPQESGGWNRIVLYVDNLDTIMAALRVAGTRFRNEVEAGPGGKQIQLEDPDGNPIELHEAPRK